MTMGTQVGGGFRTLRCVTGHPGCRVLAVAGDEADVVIGDQAGTAAGPLRVQRGTVAMNAVAPAEWVGCGVVSAGIDGDVDSV